MQYLNFVIDNNDNSTMHTGPVDDDDAAYLSQATQHLQPLTDEQYMTGPAVILHTLARYSYILDGDDLYWCTEWAPGLIIVRMAPNSELQWVALRSPVPDFGDRTPLPEDDADDYEDNNPQYNLVFRSWDAQFDEQLRKWNSFVPADDETQKRFENALERVDGLGSTMESRYSDDADAWSELCKSNLAKLENGGVRMTAPK